MLLILFGRPPPITVELVSFTHVIRAVNDSGGVVPASISVDLYPDVALHGSLAAALRDVGVLAGLDLSHVTAPEDGWALVGAYLDHGGRKATVVLGQLERWLIAEFWASGVCLSSGKTPDLTAMAGAVAAWSGGVSLAGLRERYPFMAVGELAFAHERGDAVEVKWRLLLDATDELVRRVVEAAAAEPALRQLFPFTSHQTLCFSRCTGYPYLADVPMIQPVGANAYRVCGPDQSVLADQVTPEQAVAAVVAALPVGCGPAVSGTANDLLD